MNHIYRLPGARIACTVLALLLASACSGVDQTKLLGVPAIGTTPSVTSTSPVAQTPAVTGVATTTTVSVTFNQMMSAATLTPTSFTLACPAGTPVASTVTYNAANETATLTPQATLPGGTVCVATVTSAAQNTNGIGLAAPFSWSFTTSAAPTVTLTTPAPGATNVLTNTRILAAFSADMNPASISGSSFTVMNTTLGSAVTGTVTYVAASRTAVFVPTTPGTLPANSQFMATLTTGVTDTAGNALAANYTWTFTTGALSGTTRPTVLSTVPVGGATGVPTNTQITATFSTDMDPTTITGASVTLTDTTLGTPVSGTVTYSVAARTAVFTPTTLPLASNDSFTATITTAATDLQGNALAGTTAALPNPSNYVWNFTTGSATDTTPPTVSAVSPASGSTAVCLTQTVSATFSKAMDPSTINTSTMLVTAGGVAVAGTVTYDAQNDRADFTPTNASGFAPSTAYVVTIKSGAGGVRDVAGNALAADMSWGFTTGTAACAGPVNLGSASTFGAFGGSAGVTNSGINTVVNGNLGTTAACSLVTGFHDAVNVYTETPLNVGVVNGSINCDPPAPGTAATMAIAAQASLDATSAYNALAGLPPGSDPGAGQLGGLVLQPGVYTAAGGTFDITTGDLTLDAQGNPNAQWVFQTATALTVGLNATPRHVLLINGAQARNVFWQVGSAARIEDGSVMVGTIIAQAGVTISTAGQTQQTVLTGRAISLNASVTMVNTTIVAP